jgi:hypothetical protein
MPSKPANPAIGCNVVVIVVGRLIAFIGLVVGLGCGPGE